MMMQQQNEKWFQAIDEEIHSIENNETWELTSLPLSTKPIDDYWVYKLDGQVDGYGVRLVVKYYKQKPDIDYFEISAPVV